MSLQSTARYVLTRVRTLLPLVYGQYKRIEIQAAGRRFMAGFPLTVVGGENIRIGNNFRSMGHDYLYANDGSIVIGDNLSMNTNVQIGASAGKIAIGDNVLIGPNVVLRAAGHGLAVDMEMRSQPHIRGEIIVEDDVWIGSNAVILRGVRLGKGSVVAAGAVVTKDVDPYTVVGGIPAKRISSRR